MLRNPGPGCSLLRSRQRSQLGERKACFILVLTSWWWMVQRACPNARSPHWTVRWHRGWVPVQTPALPTGQSGGTEGGCLSKRLPSPLDRQVAQRVGACPSACPPHWTVRWHRGWVPVQTPALPTGQSSGAEGGCLSKRPLSPLDSQVAGHP